MFSFSWLQVPGVALLVASATAVTIAEINGNRFQSPYHGQSLTNITGLVTAQGPAGLFVRSPTPDEDAATSESIYVFYGSGAQQVDDNNSSVALRVGDMIRLDARVTQYRSTATHLYLTELASPTNVQVLSRDHAVTPLVLGGGAVVTSTSTSISWPPPPTAQYTSLDGGDVYALPNGQANLSTANPVLAPAVYGLDYWRSLLGELVTIPNVTVVTRPNAYDETWVVGGAWPVTGRSARGSLTMTARDSNPEALLVGDPLDGTANPSTPKVGDRAADLTGVVYYQFGFFYLLPTTALTLTDETTTTPTVPRPTTSLASKGSCEAITVGDYNVENLAPADVASRADHIVHVLGAPDLLFLQEIQDGSGATDDGTVDANATLAALVAAIADRAPAAVGRYDFVQIDPVDGQDGGAPGANIRVAYLYRPEVLRLYQYHHNNTGNSTAANEVLSTDEGPALRYNPGLVDPANEAWASTRKPLAAAWLANGASKPFFTVNVHWSSKGGGSSLHGDVRPPWNGAVDKRVRQAEVTAVSFMFFS